MTDPDPPVAEGPLGAEQRSASPTGSTTRNIVASIRGTSVSIAAGYATTLIFLPAILAAVGRQTYGTWAAIASLMAVGSLADAGIRSEVMRRIASVGNDREQIRQIVGEAATLLAVLATVVGVVGVMAAPVIRAAVFPQGATGVPSATIDNVIRGAALVLAISLVVNGVTAVLPGLQRGDLERLAQVAAAPLSSVATLVAGLSGLGLASLLIGASVQLVTATTLRGVAVRRLLPGIRLRPNRLPKRIAAGYLGLSGLALLIQVSDVVDVQWDKLVLSRYIGTGAVASYQVAVTLVQQVRSVTVIAIPVLLVAMAEFGARADHERGERAYRALTALTVTTGTVLLGGVFVFGPAFVNVWLGPPDDQSAQAVRLFAVAMWINVMVAPWGARALAQKRHGLVAISAGLNLVVNALTSLVLTLSLGFKGALYGSIAGNGTGALALLIALLILDGLDAVRLPWVGTAIGLGAGALLVGVRLPETLVTWPTLGVAGIVWLGVVGPAVSWLNGLRPAEIRSLLQRRDSTT